MKRKFLMTLLVGLSAIFAVQAQDLDERYGADPAKRMDNAKLVGYMKHANSVKDFDGALGFFRQLLVNAPKASMNVYIWATDIYRNKIVRADSKAEKKLYLDTILSLYDKRMEHFGDHAKYGREYLAAQKALIYSENNPSDYKRSFELFDEAIKIGGKDLDALVISTYFSGVTDAFKLEELNPEEYIAKYEIIIPAITALVTDDEQEESNKQHALEVVEGLFAVSGAASCENIERIFRPKHEADPENADLVKKILALFERSKCSSDFQLGLAEKYYKIEPTPELAARLANIFEGRKEYVKALDYSKVAIAGEQDPSRKVAYILGAANSSLRNGNARETADFARQAIAIEPNNGVAYLLLGEAYAAGVKSCSGFDLQAAYWLVVDTYVKAREYSTDAAQKDHISSMISSYSGGFPSKEDVFFRDLQPGQSYSVNCGWVSGRTTVRAR